MDIKKDIKKGLEKEFQRNLSSKSAIAASSQRIKQKSTTHGQRVDGKSKTKLGTGASKTSKSTKTSKTSKTSKSSKTSKTS